MPFLRAKCHEGFDTIGCEKPVWKRAGGGKYAEDIYVKAHVDDCLIARKSKGHYGHFQEKHTHMVHWY
jgi:hypothetical protein